MTAAKKSEQVSVAAAQPKATEVCEISLELLDASLNNPRRTMNEATLQELAASIREHGVVPLVVRPTSRNLCFELDDGTEYDLPGLTRAEASPYVTGEAFPDRKIVRMEIEDRYEIVCGHRRSKAAAIAGLGSVPCFVRELTDEQAAEIALIDNLQREDVLAMEEAEAFGELLERLLTIPAVAAKVGKEQGYVAKRLKLLSLTAWSRDALREQLITIDHALLLCRLAEEEQNAALKWCLDPQAGAKQPVDKVIKERLERRKPSTDDEDEDTDQASRRPRWRQTWEPQSVQKLKDHIETESGIPLDRAPWPMEEDWLLADAGSCLDCPKNTKANAPLFGDLDMGVAVCTDGACFKAKTEGFVLHGIETAQKDHALPILRVSWKATSTPPRMTIGEPCAGPVVLNNFTRVPDLKQVFKAGQWVEATKKCEHARAAVTVDWSDVNNRGHMGGDGKLRKPGEIVRACVMPSCKQHPKAYENSSAAGKEEKNDAEGKAAAARQMEAFNAFRASEKQVREALYEAIQLRIKPETIKRNLLANALDWRAKNGLCWAAGFERDSYEEREAYVRQRIEKAPAAKLDALLFDAAFGGFLVIDANAMRAKDRGRAGLRELAKVAGVDAAAIERRFDQVAKAAKPKAAKKAPKKVAKKSTKKGGRK